jgi:endonuclease YncB( thermonuclease family)
LRWPLLTAALVLVSITLVTLRVTSRKRAPAADQATTFAPRSPARVLHVVDGDTAYFALEDGRWVKGRLAGINTPECHKEQVRFAGKRRSSRCKSDDELFGLMAYKTLRKLLRRGDIRLGCQRKRSGECRRGSHGRVLVTIQVDKKDVAGQLVGAGVAWSYTKYPSKDRARLCRAELAARRQRVGMWSKGSVGEVMAMMSSRTRRWYTDHDRLCRSALKKR